MTQLTADKIMKALQLIPLEPEGGYFKEVYRSDEKIEKSALPKRFPGSRTLSTSIYYMLKKGMKSTAHRLKADEIWHFYLGGPLTLVEIEPDGKVRKTIMGHDLENGQVLQYVFRRGTVFGAYLSDKAEYALIGATVAPGFEYEDFEMPSKEDLLKEFPNAAEAIELLT
jgi:predicted cupin superfamily sugar epimerase